MAIFTLKLGFFFIDEFTRYDNCALTLIYKLRKTMKKSILIISALFFLTSLSAKAADFQVGFGLMAGKLESDGTEKEGTAADSSVQTKSFDEAFVGADIFAEIVGDSGLTLGVSYVPVDFKIGSGDREDVNGSDPAENDDGVRKASADVTDLVSVYTNVPVGSNGWYGLLGAHQATITTQETLNESSYGNADINGYSVGFGKRVDKFKAELSYTDFEDIKLTATGGGTNTVTADADAMTFRISFGF
jgi:hypothetical protein